MKIFVAIILKSFFRYKSRIKRFIISPYNLKKKELVRKRSKKGACTTSNTDRVSGINEVKRRQRIFERREKISTKKTPINEIWLVSKIQLSNPKLLPLHSVIPIDATTIINLTFHFFFFGYNRSIQGRKGDEN